MTEPPAPYRLAANLGAGAMDLLDTSYNRMERLAVTADQWLTTAIGYLRSWLACRKATALDDRQLENIGRSRAKVDRIASADIAAGRSAEAAGHADEGSRPTVRAA